MTIATLSRRASFSSKVNTPASCHQIKASSGAVTPHYETVLPPAYVHRLQNPLFINNSQSFTDICFFYFQVDLTGGYYDAGDNVKFGFPMAFTTTMMSWSVIDFGKTMGPELENAVKAIKWGTDYLLKATAIPSVVFVQVGDAYSDHNCWERPEDMDTLRTVYKVDKDHPGSEVAGETAAALAAASIVFAKRDPAYSKRLLDRAARVLYFNFTLTFLIFFFFNKNCMLCPKV